MQNWLINGVPGNPATNTPPTATDDVSIDGVFSGDCTCNVPSDVAPCASLRVTTGAMLSISSSAVLDIEGPSANFDSSFVSGTIFIFGTGRLVVEGGQFNWLGGEFQGAGSLIVGGSTTASSATLVVSQDAADLRVKLVVGWPGAVRGAAPGTALVQGLNQDLTVGNGLGIQINGQGTLTFAQSSGNIVCSTGATDPNSVINNGGTFHFNTSAAIKCDLPLLNNGGTTRVLQGTLEFTKGAAGSGFSVSGTAGTIELFPNATLKADANTNINGGQLQTIGAGTAYLIGNLTVQSGAVLLGQGDGEYGTGGISTLSVGGQVSFIGTSALYVWIDAGNNACDCISASGTITLGGSSNLVVNTYNGAPTGAFAILTSGTGITGDFFSFDYAGASYTTTKVGLPLGWAYILTPAGGGGGGGVGQGP